MLALLTGRNTKNVKTGASYHNYTRLREKSCASRPIQKSQLAAVPCRQEDYALFPNCFLSPLRWTESFYLLKHSFQQLLALDYVPMILGVRIF